MGIIDGLSPFTNYSCTVHAVIMTSASAMSDPIVVRTAEAGTYIRSTYCLIMLLVV